MNDRRSWLRRARRNESVLLLTCQVWVTSELVASRWIYTVGYDLGYVFFLVKEKGGSNPFTAAIHLSRFFFPTVPPPLPQPSFPSTIATKFCSPFLPCFSPTVLWENASRGATLLVESHKEAGSQQQEEREAGRGKDLGPSKIHQISLQILDFWVKVILN